MNPSALHPRLPELLAEVEASIARVWEGNRGLLAQASRRVLSGRGKRLRPAVLLLAAECAGGATERSIALAAVVEILHNASLVHDDVVDDSSSRRGRRSAKVVWGNKVSVLLGDYLAVNAFALLPEEDRKRLVVEMVGVATRMCEGQVKELRRAGRPVSEREYLEIVKAKTAALFRFCARVGAETAGGSAELAEALAEFGERFGVAFQFADDILDLVGCNGRSGKPEARDLSEGKFTLPVILAASRGGREVRSELTRLVQKERITVAEIRRAREIAYATRAVDQAWQRVHEWLAAARAQLEPLPPSPAKQALLMIAGERFPLPVMPPVR
jgi:octaprenyl-diphosphate synthase